MLAIIESLRPKQWTKNLFIFAAILFSQNILNFPLLLKAVYAFFIFCLLSGAVYIINDLIDLEKDRSHPVKSKRPLASGRIKPLYIMPFLAPLIILSFWAAYYLNVPFFWIAMAYLLLQTAYSIYLKNIVILDVFSIAAGFVLRVVAGAVVINVEISSWLLICTMLLSLLIGLSKRRHELIILENEAVAHRQVLKEYSPYLLDQMIAIVTSSTVVAYILYTISAETVAKFGTHTLIFTVPFVLYGIFRYLYLIHQKGMGGSPENILVADRAILIDVLLWVIAVGIILYF